MNTITFTPEIVSMTQSEADRLVALRNRLVTAARGVYFTRKDVAEVVRASGFDCYEGGHHVSIHRSRPDNTQEFGASLAVVTSDTLPDFN